MQIGQTKKSPPISEARITALLWKAALLLSALLTLVFAASLAFRIHDLQSVYGKTDAVSFLRTIKIAELCYHRAVWVVFGAISCGLAWLTRWPVVWIGLVCAIVIELISIRLHWTIFGVPFRPVPPLHYNKYVSHPLLQGIPNPGTFGIYTHTAGNTRLTINVNKAANATRISAYGGSTTYEIVKDDAAWPSVLSAVLGPSFTVENHGVSGYSTVEHIIQVSFDFRKAPPRCALFYVGWNDIRSSHTEDLRPDYSNFHLLSQSEGLALRAPRSLLIRRSAFLSIWHTAIEGYVVAKGTMSSDYDARLSRIFKDNVRLIAAISKHFGVRPIFIPQVLNYERLRGSTPYGWIPFVRDTDVKRLMGAMNADLKEAARESEAAYLGDVLQGGWVDGDFVDNGHFNEAGSRKFATLIASRITEECR